jgi:hypothetical protein
VGLAAAYAAGQLTARTAAALSARGHQKSRGIEGSTRLASRTSLAHRLLLGATAAVVLSAAPGAAQELTYRIRSDLGAPLNADTGWAGELGEEVTVRADRPFRLRLEIAPAKDEARYALQARRNGDAWETLEAHDFPYPLRELEIEFSEQQPGTNPPGWTVAAGSPADLTVVDDAAGRVLRAAGGESGMMAIYPAPWPLPEFTGPAFACRSAARAALP